MNKPENFSTALQGFPLAKEDSGVDEIQALTKSTRICKGCKQEARIVSNSDGVTAHCNTCKIYWPISNSSLSPEAPMTMGRGLHKQTYVEPDWNIAFDPNVGNTPDGKIGPKGRK